MCTQSRRIRFHSLVLGAVWTVLLACSFAWFYYEWRIDILEVAKTEARSAFEKDILYRRWAARLGGMYVPVSSHTPPSPYLRHLPERDVCTPSGRLLTLVNPAYMARQVYEFADQQQQVVRGHITSLKPIRPENAADPWEHAALQAFESGVTEVSAIQERDGQKYLRLMRPFITEQACLQCHAFQGYKLGDVRGGVSVSVPLTHVSGHYHSQMVSGAVTHGAVWLFGLGMITVSARKLSRSAEALQESEERYRTVADYTADWEYWQANDGTYRYMSPSCVLVCGYTQDEFYRDPGLMMRVIHPDDLESFCKHVHNDSEAGKPAPIDYRIITSGGQTRWISHVCRVVFSSDGKANGSRVSNRDITERKRAEEALHEQALLLEEEMAERQMAQEKIRAMNAELEQRVVERTSQLEAANKELEAFAYSVSHDLRAPLRGIDGFSQALLEDYPDKLDEQGKDYLRRVRAATQRMGQLIDDLLNLSRITRTEIKPVSVDLSALLLSICQEMRLTQPDRQVEFVIQDGLRAWGDPHLLRLALENLLGNAWKFTSAIETARIEVGMTDTTGNRVYFVRDNGAGFDMAYVDKLFVPFQRLHAVSQFPGSGVGLSIVQRIIHRSGGMIWAEGKLREGATFYFTLQSSSKEGA